MTRTLRPTGTLRRRKFRKYGSVIEDMPHRLGGEVRAKMVGMLNQLLADSIQIRDMYKKHHWQVSGPTFYQLHLLFDKHYEEQTELVDTIAERIQLLGGVTIAMGGDVAQIAKVLSPPRGQRRGAGTDFTSAGGAQDDYAGMP